MAKNLVIQGGSVHFDAWDANDKKTGERLLGCTDPVEMTTSPQNAAAWCNDEGIGEKTEDDVTSVERTINLTLKDIQPENLAMIFLGSSATLSQPSAVGENSAFEGISQGLTFQLGEASGREEGVRNVSNVSVTSPIGAVENTDYTVNAADGTITPLAGSAVLTNGVNMTVQYDVAAAAIPRILSGSERARGSLRMRGRAGTAGSHYSYYFHKVSISPEGAFALKSAAENASHTTITLSVEVLKAEGVPAVIGEGVAV